MGVSQWLVCRCKKSYHSYPYSVRDSPRTCRTDKSRIHWGPKPINPHMKPDAFDYVEARCPMWLHHHVHIVRLFPSFGGHGISQCGRCAGSLQHDCHQQHNDTYTTHRRMWSMLLHGGGDRLDYVHDVPDGLAVTSYGYRSWAGVSSSTVLVGNHVGTTSGHLWSGGLAIRVVGW